MVTVETPRKLRRCRVALRLAILALVVAGCTGGGSDQPGAAGGSGGGGGAPQGRRGGTLTIALLDPGPLDPARAEGLEDEVVQTQVRGSLAGLSGDQVAGLVVAYEPVWAIGTGRAATADDAQETIAVIRATVAELVGQAAADELRIQYGGSVKASNAEELATKPDVDGALVGGASLDADEFALIVKGSARRAR